MVVTGRKAERQDEKEKKNAFVHVSGIRGRISKLLSSMPWKIIRSLKEIEEV